MDSKTRMNIFLIVQIATVPKDPRKTSQKDEYFKHFYEGFGDYINESVNKLNENI